MEQKNQESINQKVIRYTSLVIAALALVGTLVTIPKSNNLSQVNDEIAEVNKQIATTKKELSTTSPISQEKRFDLIKSEKKAQDNLYSGITYALGGAKNHKAFKKAYPELTKLLGTDMARKLYRFNGSQEDVVNDPANFEFNLLNKTDAQITFKPVTNIKHAQVNAVVTYYAKENGKEKEYRSLLMFDYNLVDQKVNNSKITNFDDSNLSGNGEAN